MNKKTTTNLTVYEGPRIDGDVFGKWHVVACGYNEKGVFGYFICEMEHANVGQESSYFVYSNVKSFHPKVDETTYQTVLNQFKQLFPHN